MRTDLASLTARGPDKEVVSLIRDTGYYVDVDEIESGWMVTLPPVKFNNSPVGPMQVRWIVQEDQLIEVVILPDHDHTSSMDIPLWAIPAFCYAMLMCMANSLGMRKDAILASDPEVGIADLLSIEIPDEEAMEKQSALWTLIERASEEGFSEDGYNDAEMFGVENEYVLISEAVKENSL